MTRAVAATKVPTRKKASAVASVAPSKAAASPKVAAGVKPAAGRKPAAASSLEAQRNLLRRQAGLSTDSGHKPAQSQVNARIDAGLKSAGDAALAAAGLTPTQAVRMLWSLAVRYRDEPGKLRAALDPDSAEPSADELAERRRKVEVAHQGADLIEAFYREIGISSDNLPDPLPYEELRELAFEERMRERGLW